MNRLAVKKRVRILAALCKPTPLRAIAKSVPASLNSVTGLVAAAGTVATTYHHRHVRDLKLHRIVCEDFKPFEDSQRAMVARDQDSGLILAWCLDGETDCASRLAEEARKCLAVPARFQAKDLKLRLQPARPAASGFSGLANPPRQSGRQQRAALAVFVRNFGPLASGGKASPALTAGIADKVWSYEDIVNLIDAHAEAPRRPQSYRKRNGAGVAQTEPSRQMLKASSGDIAPPQPLSARQHGRARETYQSLLFSARACFIQHGLHGARVAHICEAAGVSPGLLFYHFKNMEQIIEAVVRLSVGNVTDQLSAYLRSHQDPLSALLDVSISADVVQRGWDIPHGLRLEIYAESERNPRIKTIIQDGFVALMRAIEATIERAQDKGQLRGDLNKRDCAHVIGLIWNGIAMHLSADADYDLGYYQRILNDFTQHWRRGR